MCYTLRNFYRGNSLVPHAASVNVILGNRIGSPVNRGLARKKSAFYRIVRSRRVKSDRSDVRKTVRDLYVRKRYSTGVRNRERIGNDLVLVGFSIPVRIAKRCLFQERKVRYLLRRYFRTVVRTVRV